MADKPTPHTNREILKVHEGLTALDGVASKDGSVIRFEFDDSLSWNIAKDRRIFEEAKKNYDLACKTLATSLKIVDGQKVTDENAERVAKFIEGCEKIRDKTQDLSGVLRISRKDLQKAGVKIPGILSNLMPILNDA